MFAQLAERLIDTGWWSVIPLYNPGKRPIPAGWQMFNTAPPDTEQIAYWVKHFPNAGIGLASGPDKVLAVDLDFTDLVKVAKAKDISINTLGDTPLVRVGSPPKTMLFYWLGDTTVTGKVFGGYELYSTSGQVVLYSTHPNIGRPYTWPEDRPENVPPKDLPHVTPDRLNAFHAAMDPLAERVAIRRQGTTTTRTVHGSHTTLWLKEFNANPGADHPVMVANAISNASEGSRHYTMSGGVFALVKLGYRADEFRGIIKAAYAKAAPSRAGAVDSAIRWALDTLRPEFDPVDEQEIAAISAEWERHR